MIGITIHIIYEFHIHIRIKRMKRIKIKQQSVGRVILKKNCQKEMTKHNSLEVHLRQWRDKALCNHMYSNALYWSKKLVFISSEFSN